MRICEERAGGLSVAGANINLKLSCVVQGSNLIAKTTVRDPDAPLFNPEVITQVEKAWGLTLRDGYGQTEMTAAIGNTDFDALYQTERYGNFRYEADVDNGTYDVTLKFAEIYLNGAGQRLFDVKAEGKLVLDNYDIFKEAGGKNLAVDETFRVTVTDGDLDLDFISVRDNAKISGIEISPVDDLV